MELTNCSIDPDFIGLRVNGHYLDVHNGFDLMGLEQDETQKTAQLVFRTTDAAPCSKDTALALTLEFVNVSAIYKRESDATYSSDIVEQDRGCVDLIGFSTGDGEVMDGPADWQMREGLNSLLLVFVTNAAIKITADRVAFKRTE